MQCEDYYPCYHHFFVSLGFKRGFAFYLTSIIFVDTVVGLLKVFPIPKSLNSALRSKSVTQS